MDIFFGGAHTDLLMSQQEAYVPYGVVVVDGPTSDHYPPQSVGAL